MMYKYMAEMKISPNNLTPQPLNKHRVVKGIRMILANTENDQACDDEGVTSGWNGKSKAPMMGPFKEMVPETEKTVGAE
jgi:hypothetical protein